MGRTSASRAFIIVTLALFAASAFVLAIPLTSMVNSGELGSSSTSVALNATHSSETGVIVVTHEGGKSVPAGVLLNVTAGRNTSWTLIVPEEIKPGERVYLYLLDNEVNVETTRPNTTQSTNGWPMPVSISFRETNSTDEIGSVQISE